MTPSVPAPPEGGARSARLPQMARKLMAITLLAVALSFVRPYDVPAGGSRQSGRHLTQMASGPLRDAPLHQGAVLLREREAHLMMRVAPARDRMLGSVERQAV